MRNNKTKALLASGKPVNGVVVRFPSPALVEMFGYLGFDFVMIDREHGSLSREGTEDLIRAADVSGITPIVRVPFLDPKEISGVLDIGAAGVQVPEVNTRANALACVKACKFGPEGERGMAMGRGGDYGMTLDWTEFVPWSNKETMIVVHIESVEAVHNLPDMLAVDGIDVYFVGPADMSQSLGYPGQLSHPVVMAKIDEAIGKILAAGKTAGVYASSAATMLAYKKKGVTYLMISADNLIRQVTREYLAAMKA
jgi:4-hydroxy-2-oxoheptanedioate aldolase